MADEPFGEDELRRFADDGYVVVRGVVDKERAARVLLSDLTGPRQGSFTVWPGTHRAMAVWFTEHGANVPDPDLVHRVNGDLARTTSQPEPILGRAGDLVLARHLLLHTVGPHEGPDIRYATFFRLNTVDRDALGDRVFTDPWAEWDAVRPYAQST